MFNKLLGGGNSIPKTILHEDVFKKDCVTDINIYIKPKGTWGRSSLKEGYCYARVELQQKNTSGNWKTKDYLLIEDGYNKMMDELKQFLDTL